MNDPTTLWPQAGGVRLPADHPLRRRLADEVHARPPVAIPSPGVVGCLALLDDPQDASAGADRFAPLRDLAARHGLQVEEPDHPHLVLELGGLRVKWERHTEFTSYLFTRPAELDPASMRALPTVFAGLPGDWLAALPGRTIAAVDVTIVPAPGRGATALAQRLFDHPSLVGSSIKDGAAHVYTDFRLTADGRGRWLVLDGSLSPGQRARVAQRLVEIAIYRVVAMLGFPIARELSERLSGAERRLSRITIRIAERAPEAAAVPDALAEDRALLDDLTHLAADVEAGVAASAYRFAAARAYWDIVLNRIAELREQRHEGLPTIGEFLARRLAPAMNTVAATARRQQEVSTRVARSGELLRTRVDVAREEQNLRMLKAMDRRGRISLRLQQTVEGLSVAALTYYAVGLLGYALKPVRTVWPNFEPDWVVAAGVPLIAVLIWRGVHRIRRELAGDPD